MSLKGKLLLPIVQGGMGVGISASRLAGTVAALGGLGTISSVDLRRHHEDLMDSTQGEVEKGVVDAANLQALDREINLARERSGGNGSIAVNIMKAVSQYPEYVRQSCESGADAVVVGAGLPLDLPELVQDHPKVALIPILSDVRGVTLLVKKWLRRKRLPDAVVLENPRYAAGHLGAADDQSLNKPEYAFQRVLEGCRALFRELGLESERIPLIAAGGIHRPEQLRQLMDWGADGVQMGTAFAVTEEGDAHENFKRVLLDAEAKDIVTFMSVAGLPARAVRTPWLDAYLHKEKKLQSVARERPCTEGFDCLAHCGLRDGVQRHGQFCIDRQLAYALKGDVQRGLFFRSSEALPFGKAMKSVRELMDYMLNGRSKTPGVVPAV
ncbi:nitronate monooxygenase family protein [Alcaligenes ammonioxydans]|uniref:NAD(P)H-dependent flavin oxidoreductase n=1 Tax=Alcaligenes TaxID=507 RepID=UPI001F05A951|nr:nitronate monooxygenase family protein [Alcaligenes ammonioxydans]MCH1878242.1 nitronate monooxygenase family protein [Alcaligenes ammonioxydans]